MVKHLKYISLVNLVLDRPAVKELIQDEFTVSNLADELKLILTPESQSIILEDYNELTKLLGGSGASVKTADLIYNALN